MVVLRLSAKSDPDRHICFEIVTARVLPGSPDDGVASGTPLLPGIVRRVFWLGVDTDQMYCGVIYLKLLSTGSGYAGNLQ
ncbi:MAG: hypothetical protein Hals2KO_28470 [Halioglobus sp.]